MKSVMMALLAGMASILAGCASVSGDAASSMFAFPSGMIDKALCDSVRDAWANKTVTRLLMEFKARHGGRNPVVKVGGITTDPPTSDIKALREFLVNPFLSSLHQAGMIEILDAEGSVADIVLSLHVKCVERRERGRTEKEFVFQMSMTDLWDARICLKRLVPIRIVTTD